MKAPGGHGRTRLRSARGPMGTANTPSRRSIRGARERFAAGERGSPPVRGEILDSWRRSRSCGVVPDRPAVPFDKEPLPGEMRLVRAATPVLERASSSASGWAPSSPRSCWGRSTTPCQSGSRPSRGCASGSSSTTLRRSPRQAPSGVVWPCSSSGRPPGAPGARLLPHPAGQGDELRSCRETRGAASKVNAQAENGQCECCRST